MKMKTPLLFFILLGFYASSPAQVTVTISTTDSTVCAGETVTFTAQIIGCTNSYYILWNNGPFVQDTCYQPCSTWTTTFISGTHGIYCQLFCNLQGNPYSNQINMVVDPCAGVEELEGASLTTVYPNPSTENISIDFRAKVNSVYTLSIFDRSGKKINVSYEMKSNSAVFNAKQFPQGLYYFRFTDEQGKKYASGKFLIAK